MIPDCRERVIDLGMMKDVVATIAVEVVFGQGNPINGKADAVFLSDVRVHAAIVLGSRKFGGVDGVVVRNVSYVSQPAANARVSRTLPGCILRAQRRRKR